MMPPPSPPPSALADVVEGYADLLRSWVARAEADATDVAARIDAGAFDANAATGALSRCWALALRAWLDLILECYDAVALLTMPLQTQRVMTSMPFRTGDTGTLRRLSLAGDLTGAFGATIPAHRVTVLPSPTLAPGQDEFRLETVVRRQRAGAYAGTVLVTGAAVTGAPVEVPVFLSVS
jgi:hypothetical protein